MMTNSNRLSLGLSLISFCFLSACDWASSVTTGLKEASSSPKSVKTTAQKPNYADELNNYNAGIERGLAFMEKQTNDTSAGLEVVAMYQERALLTGNYDDYAKAQALLTKLTKESQYPGSTCMAQAKLHYTLHRLKEASAALDTCPAGVNVFEQAAMRADLALYSGQYREAEKTYSALVNAKGAPTDYIRLGLAKKWLGSPGEASAFLEAAEQRYQGGSPVMQSWLKLQRGLVALDRGRFDEALAMYRLASEQMEGWWLIDEHIAEVLQLTGRTDEAKQLYANIIARTGNPEFMDALATIEGNAGQVENEKKLLQQANAVYKERLVAFPEAAAGHAIEHYLQNPVDKTYVLELAQKNVTTRPYGEATIALAKAMMLSGKPEKAVTLIDAQLANGWDTAEAYWILGEALNMVGKKPRAEQAKAYALRQNPHSEEMYAFMPAVVVSEPS
jgi:predicted Zn-dependent protease